MRADTAAPMRTQFNINNLEVDMTHPLVTSAITGIGLSLFLAPGVWASPPVDEDLTQTPKGHVLPNPLAERQFNLRQTALEAQLKGKAFGKNP